MNINRSKVKELNIKIDVEYTIVPNPSGFVLDNYVRGQRIGSKSVNGQVYQLLHKDTLEVSQYVIKTIKINSNIKFKEYRNELYVGTCKNIENTGPKIYAFRMNKKLQQGEYVMDNLYRFTNNIQTLDMHSYINYIKQFTDTELKKEYITILLKKFIKTLKNFYKITNGYHGDLHLENVMIYLDSSIYKVVDVKIFDYGSFRKFKLNSTKNKILVNIFSDILNNVVGQNTKETNRGGVTMAFVVNIPPFRANHKLIESWLKSYNDKTFMEIWKLLLINSNTNQISKSNKRKQEWLEYRRSILTAYNRRNVKNTENVKKLRSTVNPTERNIINLAYKKARIKASGKASSMYFSSKQKETMFINAEAIKIMKK